MIRNLDPIYIVLHIHKCAGTTIATHIASYLQPREYIALYKMQSPYFENRTFVKSYISSLPSARINSLKVIIGHGAYYGIHKYIHRPCRYIVFLREPHARVISNYAFFLEGASKGYHKRRSVRDKDGKLYGFNTWISKRVIMHDYMTRFLYNGIFNTNISTEITNENLEKVFNVLKSFYLVGLVERPTDYMYLYDSLGISLYATSQHKTDRMFYPYGITIKHTKKYLQQDFKLYHYFLHNPHPPISGVFGLFLRTLAIKDQMISYI